MKPFSLPKDFLLGSATSATQIEGGDRNNTWYRWCAAGHIKDGSSCLRAADHWNRVEEDLKLLTATHQRTYRMSLEWSRIEPEAGVFSDEALAHYRRELTLLIANGLRPLVTLHHFSIPLWFADLGGFLNADSVVYFERYVRRVVEALGDLVQDYVTLNEPNVYATNGYYFGIWPPGIRDFRKTLKVCRNLIRCHLTAYALIHSLREDHQFEGPTRVGAAHNLIVFEPFSRSLPDRLAAKLADHLFQGAMVEAFTTGRLLPPLGFSVPGGRPLETAATSAATTAAAAAASSRSSSEAPGRRRYSDFMGINYYSRAGVHGKNFSFEPLPGTPRNDLGWEIYPEGLKKLCRWSHHRHRHRHQIPLPIWITENGTCDAADAFRLQFIYNHLKMISELIEEGIPIERYYHWSLLDNFEWLEGESGPFGLYAVDFNTQERTLRKSGVFYADLCLNQGVTASIIEKWAKLGWGQSTTKNL
ncbi:glycoside hydrolase family 1 protein [Acidaminobacter hydrogenoformans]|uniref:Beta-glucosidase n=1 Tax=Acidaminobacter hydrogenoformans DSM 2784 TaxID=1120920 RepID=A0A1G5RWK1_9FIRM|nr:glycoside hydrolase family 1 protein [Acidaminobacter hydrogenoformans]SCZ78110.1 beta-glucosidase [Acidaminobacter hydrogenoformans DSM 2784]